MVGNGFLVGQGWVLVSVGILVDEVEAVLG